MFRERKRRGERERGRERKREGGRERERERESYVSCMCDTSLLYFSRKERVCQNCVIMQPLQSRGSHYTCGATSRNNEFASTLIIS